MRSPGSEPDNEDWIGGVSNRRGDMVSFLKSASREDKLAMREDFISRGMIPAWIGQAVPEMFTFAEELAKRLNLRFEDMETWIGSYKIFEIWGPPEARKKFKEELAQETERRNYEKKRENLPWYQEWLKKKNKK